MVQRRGMGSSHGFGMGRIIVALIMAGFAIISYLGTREKSLTGETRSVGIFARARGGHGLTSSATDGRGIRRFRSRCRRPSLWMQVLPKS